MKHKILLITALVSLFVGSFLLQSKPDNVSASPVTSPVTSPITGPITFAGFKLQGKVTYKILGRWWKSIGKVIPAADVTVVAKDRDTGAKTETQTNSDGDYLFVLPEAKYKVYVAKEEQGWFVPPFKNVNLKKDKEGINFQGFKWNN